MSNEKREITTLTNEDSVETMGIDRETEEYRERKKGAKVSLPEHSEEVYRQIEEYSAEANKLSVLSFNALKIKKNFPLAYKELVSNLSSRAFEGKDILDEGIIIGTLMYSPKIALEKFFDDNKIFVNVYGSDQHWKYTLAANETSEEVYPNRNSCDLAAFLEAFNQLEKRLIT